MALPQLLLGPVLLLTLTAAAAAHQTRIELGLEVIREELGSGIRSLHARIHRSQAEITSEVRNGQKLMEEQLAAIRAQLTALQESKCRESSCPAGWSQHDRRCFLIPEQTANWLQAHRECAVLHPSARLASIHPASRQHIETLVNGSGAARVWVGLVRLDAENWGWTDTSPLDDTNWSAGDPNDLPKPSNCGQVNGPRYPGNTGPGGWNDYNCYSASHFLCQIDLE